MRRRRQPDGHLLVGEDLKEAAMACGACLGRRVDKAAKFGVPLGVMGANVDENVRQLFAFDGYGRLDTV